MRTRRSAAKASHASQRPATISASDTGTGSDGACSARASASSAVDESRQALDLEPRPLEVVGTIAPSASVSMISRRSRSAASGVRSWCDASATKPLLGLHQLLEARRRAVERLGELGDLGRALRHVGAHREITGAELARGGAQVAERTA